MYPEHNQLDPDNPNCEESSAYPANPDSEYGWEKLFSERIFLAYNRNYKIPIAVARYHNIFGPEGQGSQPSPGQEQAAATDLQAAANETAMAPGAAPEEAQTETSGEPSVDGQLNSVLGSSSSGQPAPDTALSDDELSELYDILGIGGESDAQKPFGNEKITEDEAVDMDRK